MIAFPWLVLALAVLSLAFMMASTPAGARWLRSRGADQFVYPSLRAVAIVLAGLSFVAVAWFVLAGPVD